MRRIWWRIWVAWWTHSCSIIHTHASDNARNVHTLCYLGCDIYLFFATVIFFTNNISEHNFTTISRYQIQWYYTIFHFFPDYQSWKTSAVSFENKMLSFWKSFYVFKVIIKVGNSFWDFCNNPLILTQWYYTIFKEFENLCVDKKIFKFIKYLNSIALFAI